MTTGTNTTRTTANAAAGNPAAVPACPPWCEIEDHQSWDLPGEPPRHHVAWAVALSALPYEVQGERHFQGALVVLRQDEGSGPAIAVQIPDMPGDANGVPMTLDEAAELRDHLAGLINMARPGKRIVTDAGLSVMAETLAQLTKEVRRSRKALGFDQGYRYGMACSANWAKWALERGVPASQIEHEIRSHGLENHVDGCAPAEPEPGQDATTRVAGPGWLTEPSDVMCLNES